MITHIFPGCTMSIIPFSTKINGLVPADVTTGRSENGGKVRVGRQARRCLQQAWGVSWPHWWLLDPTPWLHFTLTMHTGPAGTVVSFPVLTAAVSVALSVLVFPAIIMRSGCFQN